MFSLTALRVESWRDRVVFHDEGVLFSSIKNAHVLSPGELQTQTPPDLQKVVFNSNSFATWRVRDT